MPHRYQRDASECLTKQVQCAGINRDHVRCKNHTAATLPFCVYHMHRSGTRLIKKGARSGALQGLATNEPFAAGSVIVPVHGTVYSPDEWATLFPSPESAPSMAIRLTSAVTGTTTVVDPTCARYIWSYARRCSDPQLTNARVEEVTPSHFYLVATRLLLNGQEIIMYDAAAPATPLLLVPHPTTARKHNDGSTNAAGTNAAGTAPAAATRPKHLRYACAPDTEHARWGPAARIGRPPRASGGNPVRRAGTRQHQRKRKRT